MDATMQAFLEVSEIQKHLINHYGKASWLRDFRTMGFYVPRQNGATAWMLKQILQEPDSLLFSKYRDHLIQNFDGAGVCDVMKPKTSMLSAEVQARMHEPFELSQWIKHQNYRIKPLKLLVIEQSCVVFNNIRINKFYDWLEQSPGVTSETLILRIN
jgi:hypothetical protein